MVTQILSNTAPIQQQQTLSGAINDLVPAVENESTMQAMPLQRSTPVQEIVANNATSFATASQNQWQSQVINAGPNMTFAQGHVPITSQNALFVNNISQAITLNNDVAPSSMRTSSSMANVQSNMQQSDPWVSAGDVTNQESTSQTSTAQCDMQWQSIPEDAAAGATIANSSSSEFVFGNNSNQPQNLNTNQQQVFNMSNAMEILDSQRPSGTMLSSIPDQMSNSTVESHTNLLPQNVLPDSSMTLPFDDHNLLQTILSDLTAPPSTHTEQTPMAQDSNHPDTQSVFPPANPPPPTISQNEPVITQHQATSNDVEMVQIQKPLQAENHTVFINQNVVPQVRQNL